MLSLQNQAHGENDRILPYIFASIIYKIFGIIDYVNYKNVLHYC